MRALAAIALLVGATSSFAQTSVHRVTAYASFASASAAATGDHLVVTPARYTNAFGPFISYLVVEQPLFADTCDVAGAGTPVPSDHEVHDLCTIYKSSPDSAGIFPTITAAKTFTLTLTAFQREDTSIVQMNSGYVVVYPKLTVLCTR